MVIVVHVVIVTQVKTLSFIVVVVQKQTVC